jgi:hypothetical protein
VLSLVYSLPGILNVTIVTILFLLLFGIFFQNMLKGKFYSCKFHPSLEELVDMAQLHTIHDCYNIGGDWVNETINFDSILKSIFALFTMCTTEGWVFFMKNAVDSVGMGM